MLRRPGLARIILIKDGQELVGAAPMFFRQRGSKGLTIKVLSISGGALDKVWTPTATALFPAGRPDVLARLMAEIGRLEWNTLTAFHLLDHSIDEELVGQYSKDLVRI